MTYTIPSSFQLLDSRVDAGTAFADVRTEKTRLLNHNALLARGVRKNVLQHAFSDVAFAPLVIKAAAPTSTREMPLLWSSSLLVSQRCQSLHVAIRACKSSIAGGTPGAPTIYFVASSPHSKRPYDGGLALAVTAANTATEASLGDYSGTLNLPMVPAQQNLQMPSNRRVFLLHVFAMTPIVTDATVISGNAITDIGDNWVKITGVAGAADVGRILLFSDDGIPPVAVAYYDAGTARTYIHDTWKSRPSPGVQTATIRDVTGINLHSLSIYENNTTDFESAHGEI